MRAPFSQSHRWKVPTAVIIAVLSLGTNGCPVQTSCGVYDRKQEHPQETDAQSWTCRATVQLANGATISSPERVRTQLLARKESMGTELAVLRMQLDRLEEDTVVFRGEPSGGELTAAEQTEVLKRQIERLKTESEKTERQIRQLESIPMPEQALVLREGTWTVEEGRVTVRAQAPYQTDKPVLIPYVIRSQDGEIIETGAFAAESIKRDPSP